MNTSEMFEKIIEYGANRTEILDRFGCNTELYGNCFREFLFEPNFEKLSCSMNIKDYNTAFEAAHALKGISGNLGLTELYNMLCILVESLRTKKYLLAAEEYNNVHKHHERLLRAFSELSEQQT